jgi:hypothetical protein
MYKLYKPQFGQESVIRTSDNAFIPMDEANTDYQAYLAWVEQGNVAQPADEETL